VEPVVEVMKRTRKGNLELSGLSVSVARFGTYHVNCQNESDEQHFMCDGCEESD
jgi:hypothetical protein